MNLHPKRELNFEHTRTFQTWLAIALLAVCFDGCTATGGGSTPEAAFNTAKAACENDDWRLCFAALDPEDQDLMLLTTGIGVSLATMFSKEAQAAGSDIFRKHGVVQAAEPKDLPADLPKLRALAKEVVGHVQDKPGLFADLVGLMKSYDKTAKARTPRSIGTLSNVRIDDGTAMATLNKDSKTVEMAFVTRNGAWFISGQSFGFLLN